MSRAAAAKRDDKMDRNQRISADEVLKARRRARRAVFIDGHATPGQAALILSDMMTEGFMHRTTWVEEDPGNAQMLINEGKRQLCLMFMQGLDMDEEQIRDLYRVAKVELESVIEQSEAEENEDARD